MANPLAPSRVALLTAAALACFAANSLLCRMALRPGHVDAATFVTLRLASGAAVLAVLARRDPAAPRAPSGGSVTGALWLFGYAATFAFAYLRLTTGAGALVLFGVVQVTMLAAGLRRGERPRPLEWLGLVVAACGLVALTSPGLSAPDPVGVAWMAIAGVCWAVYSLRGRVASRPLAANAGNFARAIPPALVVSLATSGSLHAEPRGVALAVASGAVASGIGYSIWYAALRALTRTRAAIVQLAVPALAAAGGVAWLGESLSLRLVASGSAILGGVAVATLAARRGDRAG